MTFHVETTRRLDKQLKKLDKFAANTILKWLDKNIEGSNNPRLMGKPLVGNHSGKWRYRIGSYRVITKVDDEKLIILALEVGHRKDIYRK